MGGSTVKGRGSKVRLSRYNGGLWLFDGGMSVRDAMTREYRDRNGVGKFP